MFLPTSPMPSAESCDTLDTEGDLLLTASHAEWSWSETLSELQIDRPNLLPGFPLAQVIIYNEMETFFCDFITTDVSFLSRKGGLHRIKLDITPDYTFTRQLFRISASRCPPSFVICPSPRVACFFCSCCIWKVRPLCRCNPTRLFFCFISCHQKVKHHANMQYHRIKCRFRDERMVRGTSLCPHAHCRAHWNMFFRIQKDAVFSTRCTLRLVWLMVAAFSEGSSHFFTPVSGLCMKMLKQIGVCYFVIQTSSSGNFISVNLMNRPQCSVFTLAFRQHLIHYAHVYYRLYLKDGHSHYGFPR